MNLLYRRLQAHGKFSRTPLATRVLLFTSAIVLLAIPAHAVIVRGRVTDALGKPVPGARVQLIERGKVAAIGFAGTDGAYEIRSADAGRFTLLGSADGFLPSIGHDFYGGAADVLERDVVLSAVTVQQAVSVSATQIPTPVPQLTAPVTVIPGSSLATQTGIVDALRQTPGVFLAQTGQGGGVTSLFLRGGNSTANLVLVDGIPAEDVGGTFDYGPVSSTAIERIEVYRGPDSAIYGTDAGAGVITIETPRGYTLKPVLNYSGDAGTLHQYRNEATLGGTFRKLDYFGAFSRYDTSNALPNNKFHAATSAANIGYSFNGNADLRFTLRNTVAAQGLPGAYNFYNIANTARQGDQDLYSGLTAEYRTEGNWHNLVRYGIARKREQQTQFGNVGNPITYDFGFGPFTEYFGNVVTIRGANGYTATGQAAFLTGTDDQSSNRDQLYYQSDWSRSPFFNVLFGFRYDNERGSYNNAEFFEHEVIQRTNFEYTLQFQGQVKGRFSYSLGGAIEKNHLYGIAGTPRIGFSYVPVRPSSKIFHGTRLRANAATGVQEPTLALEFNSLYTQLLNNGDTADIERYRITPQGAQRSRTYDIGVDQNILGEKLVLRGGYFHNIFDHQLEGVSSEALAQYFGIGAPCPPPGTGICPLPSIFTAYVNSLAYRAQGAEVELQWQPTAHILVRGGYTFLATSVIQSFASDAVAANQGIPTENPNIPGVPIGAESPLVGARVFRRPPNTGFTTAQYTRPRFTVGFLGAYAGRSDDSTFLDGYDPNFGDTLLLPNRDLDSGYAKLDLGGSFAITNRFTAFAQSQNLLNNQHIGPIGYPSLPLTFRAGLKIRIGGD
ncbi:MAG TPA: TonB-dependent receptor [Acidobacteriaceae bacterium]|nr:TonB-dependent receptor [Acidobacteriaceae bacterium]